MKPAIIILVATINLLAGCASPHKPDIPETRIDRDAVRAEVAFWLDQADLLADEAGEPEAAQRIRDARGIARELIDAIDAGHGDVTLDAIARRLDRVAIIAIGLVPDDNQRAAARVGYLIVRGVMIRRGLLLTTDPPITDHHPDA